MITAFIGREALEALQAGREPSPRLTREKVFDDDIPVIVPSQPATRKGCEYIVTDGKLCPKCGHIHRARQNDAMPQTSKEKQEAFRARQAMLGHTEVRGIFAPPALHAAIKEAARKLVEKQKPEDKK